MKSTLKLLTAALLILASCEGVTFVKGEGESKSTGLTLSGVAKDNVTGKPVVGAEVLLMSTSEGGVRTISPGGTSQIVRRASGKPARGRSGSRGEYVLPDVSIPEGTDIQLVVRAPGFAPVYQTISRGEISNGVRLAVNSRMVPVSRSLQVPASGQAMSGDGSVRLKLPTTSLSGIRAAANRSGARAAKDKSKVVAQVSVADPKADQDTSPGKMEAKVEDKKEGTEETVALAPVALVHVEFTDEKGKTLENVVSEQSPATLIVEIPESLQEETLKDFDQGQKHMEVFSYDEASGEWKEKGSARLIVSESKEEKDDAKDKEKDKGKESICHSPEGSSETYTLEVTSNAVDAHLKHGDSRGACPDRQLFAEVSLTEAAWVAVAETVEEVCVEGRVVEEDGDPADEMWIRAEGLASNFLKEAKVDRSKGKYKITVPKKDKVKLSARIAAHGEKDKSKKEKKGKKSKKGKEEVLLDTSDPVPSTGSNGSASSSGCLQAEDVVTEEIVEIEAEIEDTKGVAVEGEVVTSEGTSAKIEGGFVTVSAESATVDLIVKTEEEGTEMTTIVPVGGSEEETHHDVGEVVIEDPVTVTGKAATGTTEDPAEDSVVVVAGNVAEVASDGTFSVEVPQSDTPVEVQVISRHSDGSEPIVKTEITIGDSTPVEVPKLSVPTETVELVGRVVNSEGDGIPGVEVKAEGAAVMITDAEGRFEGDVPKQTSFEVEAHLRDGEIDEDRTAEQSVTPAATGETEIELTIDDRTAVVEGQLKDASGAPIEGATVVSSLGAVDETEKDGRYEIPVPENTEVTIVAAVGTVDEEVAVQTPDAGSVKTVDLPLEVEDAPPQIRDVDLTPSVASPGSTVTIEVVVADNGAAVECTAQAEEGGEVTNPTSPTEIKNGEATVTITFKAPDASDWYEVPVTVTDSAGNTTTEEVSVEVRKENGAPTLAQVVPSTLAPVAGETVLVEAVASDPEDDNLEFDWTLKTEDGTDLSELLSTDGPLATFVATQSLEDETLLIEVSVTDCLASSTTVAAGTSADCTPVAKRDEIQTAEVEVGEGEARPPVEDLVKQPVLTVPDTTLSAKPEVLTRSQDATFQLTSTDSGASFECRLDAASYRMCVTPQIYAELTEGLHTFESRAKDSVGTVDPTPASYSWTIDKTPPIFAGVSTAIGVGAGQAEIKWTAATDNVSQASDIIYQVCQSTTSGGCCGSSFTATYTTQAGATTHTATGLSGSSQFFFAVRAKDKAGNVDANNVEASVAFVGSAPSRLINSGPTASCGGGR